MHLKIYKHGLSISTTKIFITVLIYFIKFTCHSNETEISSHFVVHLSKGSVQGFTLKSRGGKDFLAFRGIPFAKPPIRSLRFEPPQEEFNWSGVLNATQFKPDCMQANLTSFSGDEDCLYLNIYCPKDISELVPVIVFIHGGLGGGSVTETSPEYFMDENIILVMPNYRVGILGNFNTFDSQARGNQGLRDQVKALQWIQQNIIKFGGNPQKVTLLGHSYGAMAAAVHLFSPMSKGLFHRVICLSGTSITPSMIRNKNLRMEYIRSMAKELGCKNMANIVECFRNIDAGTLVSHSFSHPETYLHSVMNQKIVNNWFTTTIDDYEDKDQIGIILPDAPLKLLESGKFQQVPILLGIVSHEGFAQVTEILNSPNKIELYNTQFNTEAGVSLLINELHRPMAEEKTTEILNSIRQFYFGTQNISRATENNFTNMFTDRFYLHPAVVSASFYNRKLPGKVYISYFTQNATHYPGLETESRTGPPSHADDIQFLFRTDGYPPIPLGSPNFNVSAMFIRRLTEFAATGEPGTWEDGQIVWESIQNKPYKWLEINSHARMTTDIATDRIKFWDSFNLSDLYI